MLTSTGSASLNRTQWVLVLLFAFAASVFAQAQSAPAATFPDHFTFAPKPGPYAVGFRVVFQVRLLSDFPRCSELVGQTKH